MTKTYNRNLIKNTNKRVIDADNKKILEWFASKDTKERLKYYESLGLWDDVSVDRDGDIILWKE